MPKSKREKLLHMTQVGKKTREHKDRLFASIRDAAPEYQYCLVLRLDNMRNQHLKELRQEVNDSRLFLGKTKLMARALGATPEDAVAPGIDRLAARGYLRGAVGLLFTNRKPDDVRAYLDTLCPVDFARAGTVAARDVVIPRGPVYSTGGEVPAEDDVPVALALEPELRRLGMPTRLVSGKVVLEEAPEGANNGEDSGDGEEEEVSEAQRGRLTAAGYVICRAGETLDGRQSRLLRLFSICLSEFRATVLAYWAAASGEVTELEAPPAASAKSGGKGGNSAEDIAIDDGDDAIEED